MLVLHCRLDINMRAVFQMSRQAKRTVLSPHLKLQNSSPPESSRCQALAEALKTNSIARDIDLTGDSIGAKGAEASPLLRFLYFSHLLTRLAVTSLDLF